VRLHEARSTWRERRRTLPHVMRRLNSGAPLVAAHHSFSRREDAKPDATAKAA
jgi:hypothetical protein